MYIEPFPPTGEKHQIVFDGASNPLWSADGKQILTVQLVNPNAVLAGAAAAGALGPDPPLSITVAMNWATSLKK